MIGWLIQQQHIGGPQQQRRQRHAGLFTARQGCQQALTRQVMQAQTGQHLPDAVVQVIPTCQFKARGSIAIGPQQGSLLVLVRSHHLCRQRVHLLLQCPHALACSCKQVSNGLPVAWLHRLRYIAYRGSGSVMYLPTVTGQSPGSNGKQRRFARAVGTHDANAVASVGNQGYGVEHQRGPEAVGDFLKLHKHTLSPVYPWFQGHEKRRRRLPTASFSGIATVIVSHPNQY